MRVRLKREQLLELMAMSSLSQNHWAIKLGLSSGHWSDIVNGRHPYPSARTRDRILEIFQAAFDELFEIESEAPASSDQDFKAAISNRYLIDSEVGQGGMGTVYVARDVRLGRIVAIKVVSPEAVSGIGTEQFLKEIRYSAKLQHQHILPLHDAGEVAGQPYYVMPFIREGSLRGRLERSGRLSLDETLCMVRGVAAALAYAHESGVLHCDVKPANILLSGDHAFVADFGIARAIHAETFEWGKPAQIDTSAGTPAYVSPEQASGERELDLRSDVYSLACMTFEMLAGRPPFSGDTTMAVVSQRFTSRPPDIGELVPDLPLRVTDAIQWGMALEVERRPQSATAFVDNLERGARHQVSRARARIGLAAARLGISLQKALGRVPASGPFSSFTRQLRTKMKTILRSIRSDIVYAFRTFRRAPMFVTGVVLTLGLGIGANIFVFSLMNPYFFRALPFGDADRLVQVGYIDLRRDRDLARLSPPQFEDLRQQSRAFEHLEAYYYANRNVTGSQEPERILVSYVTRGMFSMLQIEPELGRTFIAQDTASGSQNVAVLDHGLWQRRYGGDPGILGRSIGIDGRSHTIIGVMPRLFVFPFNGVDAWIPISGAVGDPTSYSRSRRGAVVTGRLNSDWTIARAREELNAIHRRLSALYPEEDGLFAGVNVKPIRESLNFGWSVLRPMFALLQAVMTFWLILVCVNVASLMLARSTARAGEVAVRTALGSGRRRLIRQFLTESLVLAVAGGALGMLLAHWGSGLVQPLMPEQWFRVGEASIDGNVVLFALGVTVVTAVLFGLAPALTAIRTDLSAALKEGAGGAPGIRLIRARRLIVVCEVAMAVVLMSGVGLAARSLMALQRLDLGFDPVHVQTFHVYPPTYSHPAMEDVESYYRQVLSRIRTVPGVRVAATASRLPLNHEIPLEAFTTPGRVAASVEDWPIGLVTSVSPGYFDATETPLVAGRDFSELDAQDAQRVAIVSDDLADLLWPGEGAVGRTLQVGDPQDDPREVTIVGVVGDVHFEGIASAEHPQIYLSLYQEPRRSRFIVLAIDGQWQQMVSTLRQAMLDVDSDIPFRMRSLSSIVDESVMPFRLSTVLLVTLGIAALLLASLGIYGVIAYSVAQRGREIGIRMALGATEAKVRMAFVVEGVKLSMLGILIGLVVAAAANGLLRSLLFGVGGFDVVTFGAVLVVFVGVAAVASLLPAVRASRVNPAEALRYE